MNRCTKSTIGFGAAAFIASLLLWRAAGAEPPAANGHFMAERVSETISIQGLDVTSRVGAGRLYRQIVSTAKRICSDSLLGVRGVVRVVIEREIVRPCFDAAVSDALRQVAEQTGADLERVAGLDRFTEAGMIASG